MQFECVVKEGNNSSFYIGSTVNFKARYRAHLSSFKNEKYYNSTTLASHIHYLNKNNRDYSFRWSIISWAPSFKADIEKCLLCIMASLDILRSFRPKTSSKFTDVIPFCDHKFSSTFLKFYRGKFLKLKRNIIHHWFETG